MITPQNIYYPTLQNSCATIKQRYLPLQEGEAVIATEMAVKDDHQRDVSSSLVCIAWGLLNIISSNLSAIFT